MNHQQYLNYQPLNNHERIRRELWANVYTNHLAQFPGCDLDALGAADEALRQFDARFHHP